MRQFIVVVVMVAAAFTGGALVNGPGFRWLQARLLDYMGLKDGGEIASVTLPQPLSEPPDSRRSSLSTAGDGNSSAIAAPTDGLNPRQDRTRAPASAPNRPSAPAGTASKRRDDRLVQQDVEKNHGKVLENASSDQALTGQPPPPLPIPSAVPEPPAPKPGSESSDPATTSSATTRRSNGSPSARSPTPEQGTQSQGTLPAPLDASIGPALLASLSPSPSTQPSGTSQPRPDTIPLETAPANFPSAPGPASTSIPAGAMPTETASPATSSWASLRRKMQALGITRYTIEGEPSGPVVFSCLIPLAGRQAVSQRFEAQGEDEFHAAQAAVRRVALWRATQAVASSLSTSAH